MENNIIKEFIDDLIIRCKTPDIEVTILETGEKAVEHGDLIIPKGLIEKLKVDYYKAYFMSVVSAPTGMYINYTLMDGRVLTIPECFINPSTKDIDDIIKQICYNRPTYVQQILQKALEEINNQNDE